MKRALQVTATVFIVIGVYFALSPYLALRGLRSALHSGDSVVLEDRVDFPRLRENLKAQLNVAMLKNLNSELSENPFSTLALGLASNLVESMVDSFVTPTGIASLARGERPDTGSISPASSSSSAEPFANARVTREALDRFSVWVPNDKGEEARFVFHRYGIRWKLTGIVMPLPVVSRSDRPSAPTTLSPSPKTFGPREAAALWTLSITKLSSYKDRSNNMMVAVTIENYGDRPVKDIEITCTLSGESGREIDTNGRTIHETLPAGKTTTIRDMNMGFVHPQAVRTGCKITDLAVP